MKKIYLLTSIVGFTFLLFAVYDRNLGNIYLSADQNFILASVSGLIFYIFTVLFNIFDSDKIG